MTEALHVSVHAKQRETVELRLFVATSGNPKHRAGTLIVPRAVWDGWLYRLLNAGAMAAGVTLTLDTSHAHLPLRSRSPLSLL